MDIYIKPSKRVAVAEKKHICVEDVAEIVATADVTDKVNKLEILTPNTSKKSSYLVSSTDIVRLIKKKYPDYTVNNLGEMDTLVEYAPHKKKENTAFKWIKIIFLIVVLVIGASTAIMSFHTDSEVPKVLNNYYKVFFKEEAKNKYVMQIPYSIGLAVGIIVFFNHIAGKKLTNDPTPIEIELSLYDTDVTNTKIDILNTIKAQKEEGGQGGGQGAGS